MSLIIYQIPPFTGRSPPLTFSQLNIKSVESVAAVLSSFTIQNTVTAEPIQQLALGVTVSQNSDELIVELQSTILSGGPSSSWTVSAGVVLFIQSCDACTLSYNSATTDGTSAETASDQVAVATFKSLVPALGGFNVSYDDGNQHNVLTLECWTGAQPSAAGTATAIGTARIADDSNHSGVGGVTVAMVPITEPTTCNKLVPLVAVISGSPQPLQAANNGVSAVQVSQVIAPHKPITSVPFYGAGLQGFVLSNVGQGGDSSVVSISASVSNPTFSTVAGSNNWLVTATLDGQIQAPDGPFVFSSIQAVVVGLGTPPDT